MTSRGDHREIKGIVSSAVRLSLQVFGSWLER